MRKAALTLFAIGLAFSLTLHVSEAQAQVPVFDHLKCYKMKDQAKFTVDVELQALQAEFGLEAAQCVLGHHSAKVTQVYAERDVRLAEKVALAVG